MNVLRNTPFRLRWLATATLIVVGLIAIGVIVWGATSNARKEINELALTNADQRVWRIVEIEANVHSVQHSILNMDRTNSGHLHQLREEFDQLVRSLTHVCTAEEFAEIKEASFVASALKSIETQVMAMKPLLATTDDVLLLQSRELVEASFVLANAAESLSLASLPAFQQIAQAHRNQVSDALLDLALIIVLLFLVLFVSLAVLLLSVRSGASRTSEISATKNRLNAIVGTSLDSIIVVDQNGTILDYNGAATRMFGYAREEVIGRDMAEFIIPEHLRKAHTEGMKRYASTRDKRVVDQGLVQLEAMRKDQSVFPVELSISSAENEGGEIFVSYIRDISQRVADENELVQARDKALASEQAKADFIAVMSHEMRTPLNGLLGSLQLVSGTELNERQVKFVEVMKTSGQMLLEQVNNVLDISSADAGKVEKFEQAFEISELVNGVVSSLKPMAVDRGNTLSVNLMLRDDERVKGDKARLTQILVNLVGNALKFTKDGGVQIEVERQSDSEPVEFRVIDSGIGIPDEKQETIFEDFVTLDSSFTRAVEGTGLGLGIVRRLVNILDGEIGLESETGKGSVFWVRVPLRPVKGVEKPEGVEKATNFDPVVQGKYSVLIVEDNEINCLIASEMLQGLGCNVTEAKDGHEGVQCAMAQPFDLIFCDISMPRMDGMEATQHIRLGAGPNSKTPIIALTAHALPEGIARFCAAGMDEVIVKPLTIESLQDVLQAHLATNHSLESSSLVSVLGIDKAKEVLAQADAEIGVGLDRLQTMVVDGAASKDIRELTHKLSGVAAVVGWSSVHQSLSDIESGAYDLSAPELENMIRNARKIAKGSTAKG